MKKHIQKLKSESGVTLVELLAAIAILAIIVTAFLAFFIQAANTNNRTDQVNEATYLAQAEMENVLKFNQIENLRLHQYHDLDNTPVDSKEYNLETKIEQKPIKETGPVLYNVKVTVSQGDDILAQMETWIPLEEADKAVD